MKRQKKKWSCGAAVVRNALRVFGIRVAEHEIRAAAGTTREFGTSEQGILKAVRTWGLRATPMQTNDMESAVDWLHRTLQSGSPVILATENWEHWVLAIGSLGPSGVSIFDSSNFNINVYENGCHVWSNKKLMKMWLNDRKSVDDETEKRIYAIKVGN